MAHTFNPVLDQWELVELCIYRQEQLIASISQYPEQTQKEFYQECIKVLPERYPEFTEYYNQNILPHLEEPGYNEKPSITMDQIIDHMDSINWFEESLENHKFVNA